MTNEEIHDWRGGSRDRLIQGPVAMVRSSEFILGGEERP